MLTSSAAQLRAHGCQREEQAPPAAQRVGTLNPDLLTDHRVRYYTVILVLLPQICVDMWPESNAKVVAWRQDSEWTCGQSQNGQNDQDLKCGSRAKINLHRNSVK